MPIYEYACACGQRREELRALAERCLPLMCHACGASMALTPSLPAKRTDGIYSYAPNIGDPDKFERSMAGES